MGETACIALVLRGAVGDADLARSGQTAAFGLPGIQAVAERLARLAREKPKSAVSSQPPARGAACMSSEDKGALFVVEGVRCRGTSDAKFVGGRATIGVRGLGFRVLV